MRIRILRFGLCVVACTAVVFSVAYAQTETDKVPPSISSVAAENVGRNSATVTWTTDEPAIGHVEYGVSSDALDRVSSDKLQTTHSLELPDLFAGAEYVFCVGAVDEAGNEAQECGFSFTTITVPTPDRIPPVLTGMRVVSVSETSATIQWDTDTPSDGRVRYGTTEEYTSETAFEETFNTTHTQVLTDLSGGTLYHFKISMVDESGNTAISEDYLFTTTSQRSGGGSHTSPQLPIDDVKATDVTSAHTTVTWNTEVPTASYVEYGVTSSYGLSATHTGEPKTHHEHQLTSLIANTEYHFRVVSSDSDGGVSYSTDHTFTTQKGAGDSTPPLPVTNLAVTRVTPYSAVVSWTAPADATGVLAYDINRSKRVITEESFEDTETIHDTEILLRTPSKEGDRYSYTVEGLTPRSVWYVALRSIDTMGNVSLISNNAVLNTLDVSDVPGIALSQVENVEAVGLDRLVSIAWKYPLQGGSRVRVVRGTSSYPDTPTSGTLIYEGGRTMVSDAGLVNGKTYYYSLFLYGESASYSEPVQFAIAPYAERFHYHVLRVKEDVPQKSITKNLSRGDKSTEVEHLQEILATDPSVYPEGLVTGFFGVLTEKAVERLQQRLGLTSTGRVDAPTREALSQTFSETSLEEETQEGLVHALSYDLSYGMSGPHVRMFQTYLAQKGFLKPAHVTGFFGSLTRAAVQSLQRMYGITPSSGHVGSMTRAKILENR